MICIYLAIDSISMVSIINPFISNTNTIAYQIVEVISLALLEYLNRFIRLGLPSDDISTVYFINYPNH